MLIFNNLQEMKPYYNQETRTYVFEEDIKLNFNLEVDANICAWDINALDITTRNITALNIDARDISYWAICIAYWSFKCKSVNGRRENSIHECLDQEIEFVKD